jgi:hypothetical protein
MSFLFCPSIYRVIKMTIRASRWAIIFSLAGTLIGCNPWTAWSQQGADQGQLAQRNKSNSVVAIASLSTTASGQAIQIQGKVSQSAPFVEGGAYEVEDQTGKIWVITDKQLPAKGADVLVEGQLNFHDLALGSNNFGELFITEDQALAPSSNINITPINPNANSTPIVVVPTEAPAESPVAQVETPKIPAAPINPSLNQAPSQPQKLNLDAFLLPHKENSK